MENKNLNEVENPALQQGDVSGSLPAQECEHDFIIVATNFNNPTEKYLTSVLLECSKCDKRIAGRRQ